jgi:hypothetical protein
MAEAKSLKPDLGKSTSPSVDGCMANLACRPRFLRHRRMSFPAGLADGNGDVAPPRPRIMA